MLGFSTSLREITFTDLRHLVVGFEKVPKLLLGLLSLTGTNSLVLSDAHVGSLLHCQKEKEIPD